MTTTSRLVRAAWLLIAAMLAVAAADADTGPRNSRPGGAPAPVRAVRFEENRGQADARVRYISRARDYAIALTADEALLLVRRPATDAQGTPHAPDTALVRMRLAGASSSAVITAHEPLPSTVYYARTDGPAAPVPTFARVHYADVYPGIDLLYYGDDRHLEFDFVVAPFADPARIGLTLAGAEKMTLTDSGDLAMRAGGADVTLARPRVYQERNGARIAIEAAYVLPARGADATVRIRVGSYDRSRPLVIDPTWVTTFGSTSEDAIAGLAVSSHGEAFLLGTTSDPATFPFSQLESGSPAAPNCFLSKLDRDSGLASYTILFANAHRCGTLALSPDDVAHFTSDAAPAGVPSGQGTTVTTVDDSSGTPVVHHIAVGNYDSSAAGQGVDALGVNGLGHIFLLGPCRLVGAGTPALELSGYNETADPAHDTFAQGCTTPSAGLTAVHQPLLTVVDGTGAVLYATFLSPGEAMTTYGLAVDDIDRAYVVGAPSTAVLPTAEAYRSSCPAAGTRAFDRCGYLMVFDTTTAGPSSLSYASYLWNSANVEKVAVRIGPDGAVFVAGEGPVFDDFPSNRPTGASTWPYSTYPAFRDGIQLAKFTRDDEGRPNRLDFAMTFDPSRGVAALNGLTVRDALADLRLFASGAPAIASVAYAPGLNPLGVITTFTPAADRVGQVWTRNLGPHAPEPFALATGPDSTLFFASQVDRTGAQDSDVFVEQRDATDPGAGQAPTVSILDPFNGATTVFADSPSGVTIQLTANASDPDGDPLTYSWSGPFTNAPVTTESSIVARLPVGLQQTITVTVSDGHGNSATASRTIDVVGTPFAGTTATPVDSTLNGLVFRYAPVTITAAAVAGGSGTAYLHSRLDRSPAIPANLQAGSPPIYFDVSASSVLTAPIAVCVDTAGMSFASPADIRLYQHQASGWTDITSANQPQGNRLCGQSQTLGTFAIFYPQVPLTAVQTIAGNGVLEGSIDGPGGNPADDFRIGPATSTALSYLLSGAYDRARNQLFVSSNGYILRLDLSDGSIARIAGNGVLLGQLDGPGGDLRDDLVDGGDAFATYVGYPMELAVSATGDVLFVDRNTCRIRRLDVGQRRLFAVAGNGACGFSGDGAAATVASISYGQMAFDAAGNLFLADSGNGRIRRIDAGTGAIDTVAGNGANNAPADGAPARSAIGMPVAIAFDAQGHLLVGGSLHLLRVSPGADGSLDGGADERISVVGGCNTACQLPFNGDGQPIANPRVYLPSVYALAVDGNGGVLLADNTRIRRIAPGADGIVTGEDDEIVTTIGGYFDWDNLNTNFNGDTFSTQSAFGVAQFVTDDGEGGIIIVDGNNYRVRRYGAAGTLPLPTATTPTSLALALSPNPAAVNQPLTMTATVTSAAGVPVGGVSFSERDGTVVTPIGAAFLDANGAGSFVHPGLTAGDHVLCAAYGGSATHLASEACTRITVARASTTVTLSSTRNPSLTTGPPVFLATLAATGTAPTGKVEFFADGALLCRSTVFARGSLLTASCGGAPLAAGAHIVTATYTGDASFDAASSAPLTQVVQPGGYFALDLGFEGEAVAISPRGWVAGNSQLNGELSSAVASTAYLHDGTTAGLARPIPSLGGTKTVAVGVDDDGRVAGSSTTTTGATHAFVFDGAVTSDRHNPAFGGVNSRAAAMNAAGAVVGYADTAAGVRAFVDLRGGAVDLGTIAGGTNSAAFAISAPVFAPSGLGHIAGVSTVPGGAGHAALFGGTNATDLGTLGGQASAASAVNSAREAAGFSDVANGERHAFIHRDGTMQDIGATLGSPLSLAIAINDSAQVAGTFEDSTGGTPALHAFLHSLGTTTDLGPGTFATLNNSGVVVQTSVNRILVRTGGSTLTLGSSSSATSHALPVMNANAINDEGRIAGSIFTGVGRPRATVWIPVPLASLSVEAVSAQAGTTVVLAATLTSQGVPVANKPIVLRIGDVIAGTGTTDATGRAFVNGIVPSLAPGAYPDGIAATFAGDETLSGFFATATLTVEPTENRAPVRVRATFEDGGLTLGEQVCFELSGTQGVVGSAQCLLPLQQEVVFDNVPLGSYSVAVAYRPAVFPMPPQPRLPGRYVVPASAPVTLIQDGVAGIAAADVRLRKLLVDALGPAGLQVGPVCYRLSPVDASSGAPTLDSCSTLVTGAHVAAFNGVWHGVTYRLNILSMPAGLVAGAGENGKTVGPFDTTTEIQTATVTLVDEPGLTVRLVGSAMAAGACWQITDDVQGQGEVDLRRCDGVDGAADGSTLFRGLAAGTYVLRQMTTPPGTVRASTRYIQVLPVSSTVVEVRTTTCELCVTAFMREPGPNQPFAMDACAAASAEVRFKFDGYSPNDPFTYEDGPMDLPSQCVDLDGAVSFGFGGVSAGGVSVVSDVTLALTRSGAPVGSQAFALGATGVRTIDVIVPDPGRFVVHAVGDNGLPLPAPFDCGAPAGFPRSDCVFQGRLGAQVPVGFPGADGYVAPHGFVRTLTSMTDALTVQWPRAEVEVSRVNRDGSTTTDAYCVAITELGGINHDFACATGSIFGANVLLKAMTTGAWRVEELVSPPGQPPAEPIVITLTAGQTAPVVLRPGNAILSVRGVPTRYTAACSELREVGAVPDVFGQMPVAARSCVNDPAAGFTLGPVVPGNYVLHVLGLPQWYLPVAMPVTLTNGANTVTMSVPDQQGLAVRLLFPDYPSPSPVGGACWEVADDPQGHGDINLHRCDGDDGAVDGMTVFNGLPDGSYVLRETTVPARSPRVPTRTVTSSGVVEILTEPCTLCHTVRLVTQTVNRETAFDGCIALAAGAFFDDGSWSGDYLEQDAPLGCTDLDGLISFALPGSVTPTYNDVPGWRVNIRRSGIFVGSAVLTPSATTPTIQEIVVNDPARLVVHAVGEDGLPLPAPFTCGAAPGFARSDCVFEGVRGTQIGVGLPPAPGYVAPRGFSRTLTSMNDAMTVQWPRAEVMVRRANRDGSESTGRFCVALTDLSGRAPADFGCGEPSSVFGTPQPTGVLLKAMTTTTWRLDELVTPAGEPTAEPMVLTLAGGQSAGVVLRAGNALLNVRGVPALYTGACAELWLAGGAVPASQSCVNDPAMGFMLGPVVTGSYELRIVGLPPWYLPVVVPVTLSTGANAVTVSVPNQQGLAVRLTAPYFSETRPLPGACWEVADDPQGHGDVNLRRCDADDGAADGVTVFRGLADGSYVLRQTTIPAQSSRVQTRTVTASGIVEVQTERCTLCHTVRLVTQTVNRESAFDGCIALPAGLFFGYNEASGYDVLEQDLPLGCTDVDGLISFNLPRSVTPTYNEIPGWRVTIRRSGIAVGWSVLTPSAASPAVQEIVVHDPARLVVHAVGEDGMPLPPPFDCGAAPGFARSDCVFEGVVGTPVGVGLPAAAGYVAPRGFLHTLTSLHDAITVQWPRASVSVHRTGATSRYCVVLTDVAAAVPGDFQCSDAAGGDVRLLLRSSGTYRVEELQPPAGHPAAVTALVTVVNGQEAIVTLEDPRTGTVPAGGTLSTDMDNDGATPADPIEVSVRTPVAGTVTIYQVAGAAPPPNAFTYLGVSAVITAPAGTVANPLVLTFDLDASIVPAGGVGAIVVFRNGVEVPACTAGTTAANPNPCVASRQTINGDARLVIRTSNASTWTFGVARVTPGLATGALRPKSGGTVAFALGKVGSQVIGAFTYQKGSEKFAAVRLSAFAVEGGGRRAWFAGVGTDGRTFLAYVEDKGGRGDVFRLWIGGVDKTGDGAIASGDVLVRP